MASIAAYTGQLLLPGMLGETYTTESDVANILYGGTIQVPRYLTWARIDGSSVDTNNSPTTTLRFGLIMAQVTATGKWKPFSSGAGDGTQYARGILTALGLNTQVDGANADKFLATILVWGCVNPAALCVAEVANYGLARTGVGLTVRKHFKYNFQMSDDFANDLVDPLSGR